jgi:hypothetical protein
MGLRPICAESFGIQEAESFRSVTLTRPLERSESLSRGLDPWAIRWPITFSRNPAPDFTHYLSERPEMSSQWREIKEGQNNEWK